MLSPAAFISGIYMCAFMRAVLFFMSAYRKTVGFLICLSPTDLLTKQWGRPQLKKKNVLMINAITKIGLISVFETRKCENVFHCTGLLNTIQMASHCNISSISML